VPGFTKTIKLVGYGEQWMAQQHSWPGESHDVPRLSFSSWLVAVDWAVSTSRLVFSVRTFLQPQLSIVQKFLAPCTQDLPGIVMVNGTIDADHLGHRQRFSTDTFSLAAHVFLYLPT